MMEPGSRDQPPPRHSEPGRRNRAFIAAVRQLAAGGVAVLVTAAALGAAAPPQQETPPQPDASAVAAAPPAPAKLIVVSWDGAADWVVDRLLAEGRLPNLARLAARGVAADYAVSTFPSKTAAAHAALWTGCWPPCSGITGNRVPLQPAAEHTLLEHRSGYRSEALTAEPLFATGARAGRSVVVLSATQSYPPEPILDTLHSAGVPPERYRSFSGFELPIARGRMIGAEELTPAGPGWRRRPGGRGGAAPPLEATFTVGDDTFFALVYDDPADPVEGLDTVLVRQGSRARRRASAEAVLKPREAGQPGTDAPPPGVWSPPFAVRRGDREGATYFRLFTLASDGSRLALYQRAASALGGAHSASDLAAYRRAYPAFHDDPFPLYDRGGFGPTLAEGGDGTAESRVLELVAFDTDLLIAGTRFALAHWAPDLLFHYSPMVDSAGHSWVGAVDPTAHDLDTDLMTRTWPFYARVYAELDRWLGSIVDAGGDTAAIAVVSDHGMAATRRHFYPNRALEEAGLLARTPEGEIDLARTRVLQPSFGDFYFVVNGRSWQGGVVAEAERSAAIEAAVQALLAARDPDTGIHPVERIFRPEELPGLGIGGSGGRGGDLYFDLAPGYYPRGELADRVVEPVIPRWGKGDHGFWPERRSMHAIFYAAGPGLATGVTVPAVRHIDVAPTLAHLLGIPAPAQAAGRVIAEALSVP